MSNRLESSLNFYQEGILKYTKVIVAEGSLGTLLSLSSKAGRVKGILFKGSDIRDEDGQLLITQVRATVDGGSAVDILASADAFQVYLGDGVGVTAQQSLTFDLNIPFKSSVVLEANLQLGAGVSNIQVYVLHEEFS